MGSSGQVVVPSFIGGKFGGGGNGLIFERGVSACSSTTAVETAVATEVATAVTAEAVAAAVDSVASDGSVIEGGSCAGCVDVNEVDAVDGPMLGMSVIVAIFVVLGE